MASVPTLDFKTRWEAETRPFGWRRPPPTPEGERHTALGDALQDVAVEQQLEAMECRVEGALVDLQDIVGDLLDPLRDRPAMKRLRLQRPQDERVERTWEKVGDGAARHDVDCRH